MVRKKEFAYYAGALISAALFIFFLPHISFGKEIILFFLPLPFIILSALSPYTSIAVNILFGLAVYGWVGKIGAMAIILGIFLFSWAAGLLIYFSFSPSKIIIVSVILGLLGAGVFFLAWGGEYLTVLRENLDRALADSISFYKAQGIEEKKLEIIRETMEGLSRILMLGFPAMVTMSVTAVVIFNYFLARRFLGKAGYKFPTLLSPAFWKIPDPAIWVFIAAAFCIFGGKAFGLDFIYRMGLNFMILALAAYLVQGIILADFFLKKWRAPVFLKSLVYIFLLLQPVFLIGITLFGIFDVWFNFRRLEVTG